MKMIVLALLLAMLAPTQAAAEDEAARALARWEANQRTNATVAYEAGRDYLRHSPQAEAALRVRAWLQAYDKVSAHMRKPFSTPDEAVLFLRENLERTIAVALNSRTGEYMASLSYLSITLEGCTLRSRYLHGQSRAFWEPPPAAGELEKTSEIDLARIDPRTIQARYEPILGLMTIIAGSLKPGEPAFNSQGTLMDKAVPFWLAYPFLAEPTARALKILAKPCGNAPASQPRR